MSSSTIGSSLLSGANSHIMSSAVGGGRDPPSRVQSGPIRPTFLDTSGEAGLTNSPAYTRHDQMEKVLQTIRSRNVKIAVISNGIGSQGHTYADKAMATSIATELNQMLSGSKALVYEYEIKDREVWFNYMRSVRVTYYIFVNLPPFDPYCMHTPEREFFNPHSQRIAEVVVIHKRKPATTPGGTRTTAYTPVHYLERFQHLSGIPKDIASMALCHFAASQPVPHPTDKVYWSQLPKVYHIQKNHPRSSLGISIMTREMAQKSHFPRIVLVKSLADDCVPFLRDCVGRYTHIQSVNGILLDGLTISDATIVFQSATNMTSVQLVVRYVHPIVTLTHNPGLTGGESAIMTTPITPHPEKQLADRIDPTHETLPVPLMILGDIYVSCRELFKHLSRSPAPGPASSSFVNSTEEIDSQVSIRTGGSAHSNSGNNNYATFESNVVGPSSSSSASSSLATPTITSSNHHHHQQQQQQQQQQVQLRHHHHAHHHHHLTPGMLKVPRSCATKSETSLSSFDSHEGSDVAESFQSDKYVLRLSVARSLFCSNSSVNVNNSSNSCCSGGGGGGGGTGNGNNIGSLGAHNCSLSSPSSTPVRSGGTGASGGNNVAAAAAAAATVVGQHQQPQLHRQNTYHFVDKRYILNIFTQDVDRKFVHLYLRQSSLYLVVVSLEDMVEDPVIHFENLSFWLRLVQTYTKPSGVQRVIIVGMSDEPLTGERELECLDNLEGAIREVGFQHVYNCQNKSIIRFDRSSPRASVERLCSAISKCMDEVVQRAWHFHREFFDNVFRPFTGLTEVLQQMSRSQETMVSADSLLSVYQFADPNYFDTLAAHSSALVDDRLDTLLKPGFLVDLMKKLSLNSENYRRVFAHHIPQLKNLPVVMHPWPMAQISNLQESLTQQQQTSIVKWAERFELFYSLGYSRNHEVYFIPLLATEFLAEEASYDWPFEEEREPWFSHADVITLYAKLNFSAVDHFFYSLLSEILRDVVNNVQHSHDKNNKCYIRYLCREAVLPIRVANTSNVITVYLKYHLLQNVIEFRTRNSTKSKYLYQVADEKLKAAAISHSKHSDKDFAMAFKGAVTFCVPSDHHEPDFVDSCMGKLCGLTHNTSSAPSSTPTNTATTSVSRQQSSSMDYNVLPLPLPPPPEEFASPDGHTPTTTDVGNGSGGLEMHVATGSDDDGAEHDQLLMMRRVTDKEWLFANQDMKKKISSERFIQWGRRLSSEPDNWAMVASKLRLMSREDVDFFRNNPKPSGNGGMVLSKWVDSDVTFKELTDTLRCEEVRLDNLADDIEGYFGATTDV